MTYEPIPTVQGIKGIANHCSTATLFTLGQNYTVQQYDVENPSLVANVQRLPSGADEKAPDTSTIEQGKAELTSENLSQNTSSLVNRQKATSPAPLPRPSTAFESQSDITQNERLALPSPQSDKSRTNSASSAASSNRTNRGMASPASRSIQSGTTFSMGSPRSTLDMPLYTGSSFNYPPSSMPSARSFRGGSRLRHEIVTSPVESPITDLFPYTRSRLNDVAYQPPRPLDDLPVSPDNQRRQMLGVVFGWNADIEDLIRDECKASSP